MLLPCNQNKTWFIWHIIFLYVSVSHICCNPNPCPVSTLQLMPVGNVLFGLPCTFHQTMHDITCKRTQPDHWSFLQCSTFRRGSFMLPKYVLLSSVVPDPRGKWRMCPCKNIPPAAWTRRALPTFHPDEEDTRRCTDSLLIKQLTHRLLHYHGPMYYL